MLTTRINNKNFDANCITMDTVINPISPYDRSISPSVISIDMTRISSFENDINNKTNSSDTNIYQTEWKHSLKQIMMSKIPLIEKNVISVIELPSLQSNLVSSKSLFSTIIFI
ncbi:unnamed protein product [Rotaria sordida]|uniref:Uncharacterized protein n=1 Tax=Rotaria sordida TaxID=392033 RepID=A0A815Z1V4_9BILA|nr:unnamed protein product [Rotaria sordida]CAF1578894.1 unnamed protein product [Rotaria sordida]